MAWPQWPAGTADSLERALLERWGEEQLFRRTLEQTAGGPSFVFFEGPPTANGRPGIHHVFARTIKDLVCRYHAMLGQSVTRIAGWDTHGLPVEIEVEKQLQLSGKQDIERFGVEKFNALCRESVFRYEAEWRSLSDRIGYWLDYEHPYITCSNRYIESVWWLLSRLYEQDLLYRGHRVLPYCPRCGTVLSSHELAQGYDKVTDKSIYVTFPLEDGTGRELVVWTTTPWTLPANVAVAVNPALEYVTVEVQEGPFQGRSLVLAGSRAADLFSLDGVPGSGSPSHPRAAVRERLTGSDLVGRSYRRPLEVVDLSAEEAAGKRARVVVAGDFVTAEDGSGMVHLAPAFGADDYAAGQREQLALVRPVGPDGTFIGTSWPDIEGALVTAAETNETIIRRLKAEGRLLRQQAYEHDYPFCWRCGSKLIYYARDSWFVRTSAVRERMLAFNRDVDWHPPEIGAGRFGEWLENNVDWALSRDRYWGTPLPVWRCDRDETHREVIGSYARLAERWGRPLPENFDPHKPFIDRYEWSCDCGGTMRRTPEVIDAWFDSGSMPYAQWHYPFEGDGGFRSYFPADFICEGLDQTRGWFYSLLAIATAVFDQPAYRHVIVNGLVLDAQGQKMSKSRGNVVDPGQVIGEVGADAVRLYLLGASQVGLPKRFDRQAIPDVVGGFLNTLRNTYHFFASYAGEWAPGTRAAAEDTADRWLRSRLAGTVRRVREAWDGYDVTAGTRAVMDFVVDDLSNWYVRLNRGRFWAPDAEPDPAATATLHAALVTVARLLAPAAPFVSDWLHRALTGTSVHLAAFPSPDAEDAGLETAMDAVRRLASLARAARERAGLKVRQPLARLQVAIPAAAQSPLLTELLPMLTAEVNVKAVEVVASDTDLVRLRARPNFRSLGKRFGKRTPRIAQAAEALAPEQLRALELGTPVETVVDGEPVTWLPEDVTVEREVASDWVVESDGPFVAAVDPRLDAALRAEGLAREAVNRVQRLRKEAGYDYTTRISLGLGGTPGLLQAVTAHAEFIKTETLARELVLGGTLVPADLEQDLDIDGERLTVAVRRYDAGRP